ncbi:MAG: CheY-like chemotaxis protein [Lentisphaeria bacterium]|jgi:CheY-like chemotaxis protein
MEKPEFSLFCHPTTTVFIDDNKDFLTSLTLQSEPGSFKTFDDPHEGLAYIEAQSKLSENFAKGAIFSANIDVPHKLSLPQHQVCERLNNLNRFSKPCVVVVDFSMPHLNGLELCSQLSHAHTKKILLTGVANEKQAINALNSDLIDFYIDKSEDDLATRLNTIISTLTSRYFMDTLPLTNREAQLQMPFLFDPEFADFFEQKCEDFNVVEYYYVTNPNGFLLIDRNGVMSRLIIYTRAELDAVLAEMVEGTLKSSMSQDCINTLKGGNHIPFFQNQEGCFEAQHIKNWREHTYPIISVQGKQEYCCAIIEKKYQCLTSYAEYLNMPSNRLH